MDFDFYKVHIKTIKDNALLYILIALTFFGLLLYVNYPVYIMFLKLRGSLHEIEQQIDENQVHGSLVYLASLSESHKNSFLNTEVSGLVEKIILLLKKQENMLEQVQRSEDLKEISRKVAHNICSPLGF